MKLFKAYQTWAKTWSKSQVRFLLVMSLLPLLTAIFIYCRFCAAVESSNYWRASSIMQENRLKALEFPSTNNSTIK